MASPTVLNSDAALNGKTLLVLETPASVTGGLTPASDTVAVGLFRMQTTTLTAAQVKALHSTPIVLVTAPGSGKVAIPVSITFGSTFVTPAYTGANNLEFRYTDGSGVKVTADITSTILNFTSGTQYNTVNALDAAIVPVANAAIVVAVPVANPAAGNSPVTLTVGYYIVTSP